MKKTFLTLLVSGCLMISCEWGEELVSQEPDCAMNVIGSKLDSLPATRSFSPKIRSFYLDIEGGDYSVGIINRLKSPKEVIIVTKAMCPYYYESYVPEMEIDGYEPEGTDIEILATNSSMPYIEGFWDDYGIHCNVETYYYGVLWGESRYITVIFDPNGVTWRDPLPVGVDDIAGSTGEVKSPQVIDVAIIKERLGEAFDITATYMNRFGGVEQANIGMFTNLCYVNAESPLALSVHNTTSYLGQLTFETNDGEKVVRLRGGERETLNYDLQNTNDGVFNIRIK